LYNPEACGKPQRCAHRAKGDRMATLAPIRSVGAAPVTHKPSQPPRTTPRIHPLSLMSCAIGLYTKDDRSALPTPKSDASMSGFAAGVRDGL
jgi:hypothetical protein